MIVLRALLMIIISIGIAMFVYVALTFAVNGDPPLWIVPIIGVMTASVVVSLALSDRR